MRVAFGTDEKTQLAAVIAEEVESHGGELVIVAEGETWPEVGSLVGRAVVAGEADRGVVCCWTGTGVSMAANKVPGIRAALCTDAETARGARMWNDANVLALSLRLTTPELAREMVEAFLTTDPDDTEAHNYNALT